MQGFEHPATTRGYSLSHVEYSLRIQRLQCYFGRITACDAAHFRQRPGYSAFTAGQDMGIFTPNVALSP